MATEINTIEDLDNIRNDLSGDYKLTKDLDFNSDDSYEDPTNKSTYTTGSGWTPIGDNSTKFTGTFDGQGYTISNLYIDRSATDYIGLFGYSEGLIRNMTLSSVSIIGNDYVGSFCGYLDGVAVDCSSSGTIEGNSIVGGFVGMMTDTVAYSDSSCSLTPETNDFTYTGGFIGKIESGSCINCYSTGDVLGRSSYDDSTASDYIGGFVGHNNGSIIRFCYSTGQVQGSDQVGGFVGYNTNAISSANSYIEKSYSTGNITGIDHSAGFCGINITSAIIKNCYSTGDLSISVGSGIYLLPYALAGFCGENDDSEILRCYSTGKAQTSDKADGFGFIGKVTGTSYRDYANFWDIETSEMGVDRQGDSNAEGKTTSEMQDIDTFLAYNWDIVEEDDYEAEIWVIDNSYPEIATYKLNFKEMTTTGNQVKVSESSLQKKENNANMIKFKCVYDGKLAKNIYAKYLDRLGNIIIDGKIKHIKEVANEPATGKKVYEITMYDKGIKFNEGNLNTIYDADQSPEDILQTIVEELGFVFINNTYQASGVTLTRPKKYIDRNPIEAINDLCEAIGVIWRVDRDLFIIERKSQNTSPYQIDGTGDWILPDGWEDDTSRQCNNVIVKGAIIEQKTTEYLTGTGTVFYTAREPKDVQIAGLTQTTESIEGDYTVYTGTYDVSGTTKKGKIVFETSQTDPTVTYSYDSQVRVRKSVDAGDITKEVQKRNITSSVEAREYARNYLDVYKDGFSTSKWETKDINSYNINNFRLTDLINVTNKLNSNRDGTYVITKIERRFPEKIKITVGQDVSGLIDWQNEAKERIKQLAEVSSESDFVQIDESLLGDFAVTFSTQFTSLYTVEETGEILIASDTTLTNDSDLISDNTGTYAMAVDDNGLSDYPTSYTNYL